MIEIISYSTKETLGVSFFTSSLGGVLHPERSNIIARRNLYFINYLVVDPNPPLRVSVASSSSVIPYVMKIPWAIPWPA